jgi:hypothetical protein
MGRIKEFELDVDRLLDLRNSIKTLTKEKEEIEERLKEFNLSDGKYFTETTELAVTTRINVELPVENVFNRFKKDLTKFFSMTKVLVTEAKNYMGKEDIEKLSVEKSRTKVFTVKSKNPKGDKNG